VPDEPIRSSAIAQFEREAEVLVIHHLDLLAQIEAQLRAVHRTMRRIYSLRDKKLRIGRELTNDERASTLTDLSTEIALLDRNLVEEHECCGDMQRIINVMQAHLNDLKRLAERVRLDAADSEPPDQGGSPDAGGSAGAP
jgi:hypothetical protein